MTVTTDRVVRAEEISRSFELGGHTVQAIRDVSLGVEPGTFVAIRGRSGSGKTTLLNILGGLDRPTDGRVWINDSEITAMPEPDLVEVRRHEVGFIFQAFGLIPILTAKENIEVPLRLANTPVAERDRRSRTLLELVGLGERGHHRPHELSGGEQQRVAIARALANEPRLLLADEPTGQLDSRTGGTIVELLAAIVRSEGVAAIVATHDPAPLLIADRVLDLKDGRLVTDAERPGGISRSS